MTADTAPKPGADPAGRAAEAAAAESARQTVALLFALATTPFLIRLAMRHMREQSAPDAARTERMSLAKRRERFWARAAGYCWQLAEQARLSYERERPA